MKDRSKGFLQMLLVVASIALLLVVVIIGIGPNKRGSLSDIKLGLDLAGGVSITYEAVKENPTTEEMNDTVYKLQKRVENYDTEAVVYKEGNNRINVDIPGVEDANKILEELGQAGALEFKDEAGKVVLDGADIQSADAAISNNNSVSKEYLVELVLTADGTKKFATATTANVGKTLSIYYDNKLVSAPSVKEAITGGKAYIDGQESYEEAKDLASIIRIGALPLELKEVRSNIVGAKLGAEAINTSLFAGIIGLALVIIFMTFLYRMPGFASSVALVIYVAIMLICLNIFNVTLTLPGIAGMILSIGMAVDANVIIFTRIREEITTGKTIRSSIKIGFHKALSAIIDGNISMIIVAAVLWFLGSGNVKGFAPTLIIGNIVSMFTALTVTRFIIKALCSIGFDKEIMFGRQKEFKQFPFVKHTMKFFVFSAVIITIGIVSLFVNKAQIGSVLNYGLDFKGGTSTTVTFNETLPADINSQLETLVSGIINDSEVDISQVQDSNEVIIKTKELDLAQRTEISDKLVENYSVDPQLITTESISGTISSDMRRDAIVSIIVALACMLIYIWFRFKDINFAVSAIIALVHDVLIVIMVYAVTRISASSTFIACLLTIVGFSVNGTIIIFDRMRENIAAMRTKDSLEVMVDTSINQTISRCINTNLATFFTVLVLFLFGVDSIKDFAGPLMAGIICGTYTSVCFTGALWYFMKKKFNKKIA
jgi:SecD/SecF fusion protein